MAQKLLAEYRLDLRAVALTVSALLLKAKALQEELEVFLELARGYTLILDGPELKLQSSLANDHQLIQVSGGTFILKASTIEDNSGGGVWVKDCGSFIMEGGTISDNKVSTIRGGVFVGKNGIFTMKDGLIEKNIKGGSGGGVL